MGHAPAPSCSLPPSSILGRSNYGQSDSCLHRDFHRVCDDTLALIVSPGMDIISVFLQPSPYTPEVFLRSTKILQELLEPLVPCGVVRDRNLENVLRVGFHI